MRAIGFRAEPSALNWAVVEGPSAPSILIDADVLKAPETYSEASGLKWFREKVYLLIDSYSPGIAAVKSAETFMPRPPLATLYQRCRVEGVVIEALNSRGIEAVIGPFSTVSSGLGTTSAKQYLKRDDMRGLDWRKYKGNRREAILVAVSALGH